MFPNSMSPIFCGIEKADRSTIESIPELSEDNVKEEGEKGNDSKKREMRDDLIAVGAKLWFWQACGFQATHDLREIPN